LFPGIIEAENFDNGGEGLAYHDSEAANLGGEYRLDDGVDIKANAHDGGHAVGFMSAGEWLEYTVNVQEAGDYRISANADTIETDRPSFTLSIDGSPVASVIVPSTGSWDTRQVVEVTDVHLNAGEHLMRIDVNEEWLDIDFLKFEPAASSPPEDTVSPSVAIVAPEDGAIVSRWTKIPVRIEASDDDSGVDPVVLWIAGEVVARFSGDGVHSYSWRPRRRQKGEAVIEAVATDFAGHVAMHSVKVTVK
jgi:hypothetical protein